VALHGPDVGYYLCVICANNSHYAQVVQFPESARDKAIQMKDAVFSSFKVIARTPAGQ
jgi:hypothetical protein